MTALDYAGFRAELKKGVSGGYLFCGDEGYLLRHSLRALVRAVFGTADDPFNHVRIDYADDQNVADAVAAMPAFADKRIVEVWGCDFTHARADFLEPMYEAMPLVAENPQTVLVVCVTPYELDVSGGRGTRIYNELSKYLCPVVFAKETPASLAKWAGAHFAHENVAADRALIQLVIDRVGRDMYALAGEIDKLCAYVRAQGRDAVTEADVLAVVTLNPEIGAFDFSNAVTAGDLEKAMFIFSQMRSRKQDPTFILSTVTSCYVKMERVSALADDGCTVEEIMKKLKMKQYPVKINLAAARRLGKDKLEKALRLCGETDYKVKYTGGDNYVKVSRLVAALCAL